MPSVPVIVGDLLEDALAIFGVPGATAGRLVASHFRRRAEEAADILRDELRRAQVSELHVTSEDEAAASLFRYLRAVRDQNARLNLRLMARALLGLSQRDQLFADEFLKHADMLAGLSREEVQFVAALWRAHLEHQRRLTENPTGKHSNVWMVMRETALPGLFPTENHLAAVAARAQRSGLVVVRSVVGGNVYEPSPYLADLVQLVDFEDVLAQERRWDDLRNHR